MGRGKSPGLKILWIWTFGTAAVLVTSVMSTKMREMKNRINAQDQDPHLAGTISGENAPPESVQVFGEEKP